MSAELTGLLYPIHLRHASASAACDSRHRLHRLILLSVRKGVLADGILGCGKMQPRREVLGAGKPPRAECFFLESVRIR